MTRQGKNVVLRTLLPLIVGDTYPTMHTRFILVCGRRRRVITCWFAY